MYIYVAKIYRRLGKFYARVHCTLYSTVQSKGHAVIFSFLIFIQNPLDAFFHVRIFYHISGLSKGQSNDTYATIINRLCAVGFKPFVLLLKNKTVVVCPYNFSYLPRMKILHLGLLYDNNCNFFEFFNTKKHGKKETNKHFLSNNRNSRRRTTYRNFYNENL